MSLLPLQRSVRPRTALRDFTTFSAMSLAVSIVACSPDNSSGPTGIFVPVCHMEGAVGTVTNLQVSELPVHKSHGDYVTLLNVDPLNAAGDSIHFRRVTDALSVTRAGRLARGETQTAACRITIAVAPVVLKGSIAASSDPLFEQFPLVIDVPDITLKGALKMQVDAMGRATGIGDGGTVTTFSPSPALIVPGGSSSAGASEEIIIVNGQTNGPKGNGAVIEGFTFQSGRGADVTPTGGQGILSLRVKDLVVRGNRFDGGFTESIDLRAASAVVERNYLSGLGAACDICVAGPGDFIVRDNRILGKGGIPGIAVTPILILPVPAFIEQISLPAASVVTAALTNNEVKDHSAKPVGVGIRVDAVGNGGPNVAGMSKVTLTGNNLVGNTFGIMVHGAFPVAGTTLRGDVELTTSSNTFSKNCQTDFYVTFNRHQNGWGGTSPYPAILLNSTYRLSLGADISWDAGWYSNPAGNGNKLIVNGQDISNGARTPFDAARVCP
ncbi:MAG TPA: hypothetical protein VM166_15710 [Gemmatimonadaceae bacterium]|nr:hypothetical protein [Gemmatimonadaceae bacterium]